MKNNTKNMWVYMAILFSIAILLILITTLAQSKIVDNNGDLSVLGSFTATTSKKIENLQTENTSLKTDNANLAQELAQSKTNYNAEAEKAAKLTETVNAESNLKQQVADLYSAYKAGDKEKMETLLASLTQEQIDERIPNLYNDVKTALSEQ